MLLGSPTKGASLATAAKVLNVPLAEVERLAMEVVDAGMVGRSRVQ